MAERCNPDNFAAAVFGKNASDGFSYPEPDNIPDRFTVDQHFYMQEQIVAPHMKAKAIMEESGFTYELPYDVAEATLTPKQLLEKAAQSDTRIQTDKGKSPQASIASKANFFLKEGLLGLWYGGRQHGRPSQQFGDRVWQPIYQEEVALAAKYGGKESPEYRKEYAKTIGKKAEGEVKYIQYLYQTNEPGSPKIAEALQGRYGITPDKAWDLVSYMEFVANPFKIEGSGGVAGRIVSNVSSRQGPLNFTWATSNVGEMARVIADYSTKPGGIQAVISGFGELMKNGNPFSRHPDLERAGVYGLDKGIETEYIHKNDNPFSRTNTMLVNFAHYTGQAFDGNGERAVRESTFHTHYLDAPKAQRDAGSSLARDLLFGLVRYPINEAIWYYNTTRNALNWSKPADALQAMGTLAIASLARSMWFGTAAAIPTPLMLMMQAGQSVLGENPVTYEQFEELDKQLPTNLMGKGLSHFGYMVADVYGGVTGLDTSDARNYTLNFGKWAQPGGGALFVRAAAMGDTFDQSKKLAAKAITDFQGENYGASALDAGAGAMTLMMMAGIGPWWAVNHQSATLFRKTATEYNGDGKYGKAVMEAMFGTYNVKEK